MPKKKKSTKTGRKLVKEAKADLRKLELELSKVKKGVAKMMTHVHDNPPPPPYSICP